MLAKLIDCYGKSQKQIKIKRKWSKKKTILKVIINITEIYIFNPQTVLYVSLVQENGKAAGEAAAALSVW